MTDAFEIVAYKLQEPIWNNFETYHLFNVKYDIPITSEFYSADVQRSATEKVVVCHLPV